MKFERKVGDYAIAAVAVHLVLNGPTITAASIGLTNAGPKVIRATTAEQALVGQVLSLTPGANGADSAIRASAHYAAAAADPVADLRGSVEYKRSMIRTLMGRALRLAYQRALEA